MKYLNAASKLNKDFRNKAIVRYIEKLYNSTDKNKDIKSFEDTTSSKPKNEKSNNNTHSNKIYLKLSTKYKNKYKNKINITIKKILANQISLFIKYDPFQTQIFVEFEYIKSIKHIKKIQK